MSVHRDAAACAVVRESVSADLDGEVGPLDELEVARHLRNCDACNRFATAAHSASRRVRLAAVQDVPDLSAAIMTGLADEPSRSSARWVGRLRVVVAMAGVAQMLLAVPLVAGMVGADPHLGRDLAALQLALGVGLILAAVQPHRAAGVLPVIAVVAGATLVLAGIDVAGGVATWTAELVHVSEIIGVLALWALSRALPAAVTASPVQPRRPVGAA
jgi:predicted anti-sigma-YlaC factor YlaD